MLNFLQKVIKDHNEDNDVYDKYIFDKYIYCDVEYDLELMSFVTKIIINLETREFDI
jgi:hypothetical protein